MSEQPEMVEAVARAICLGELVKVGVIDRKDLPAVIGKVVDESWPDFRHSALLVIETINRLVKAESKAALPALSTDLTGVTVQ